MSAWEAARQAFRQLRASPLRSALTLFGLVWGTAAVIFLLSWGDGLVAMLERNFEAVGKNLLQVWPGRVSEDFTPVSDRRWLYLTQRDVEHLREHARVSEIVGAETRRYVTAAFRQRSMTRETRGVEPETVAVRGIPLASGRSITRADVDLGRRVAVVGHETRKRLLGPESGIGSRLRLDGKSFRVVGILERVGAQLHRDGALVDEQIWVPLSVHHKYWPNQYVDEDLVGNVLIRMPSRHALAETRAEVHRVLGERLGVSPHDEEAFVTYAPTETLSRVPIDKQAQLNFLIAGGTLLISGIGILSMMLDSVRERRAEIAVRLVCGATRRDILVQFFLETATIVLVGGGLGVALGVAGAEFLASDWFRGALPPAMRELVPIPLLSPSIVATAAALVGVVTVTSGVVPALRAAAVQPAQSLRAD